METFLPSRSPLLIHTPAAGGHGWREENDGGYGAITNVRVRVSLAGRSSSICDQESVYERRRRRRNVEGKKMKGRGQMCREEISPTSERIQKSHVMVEPIP